MSRHLTLNWDNRDSITQALKELKEYQKKLYEIEKKFCVALAEVGRQKAQEIYDGFGLVLNESLAPGFNQLPKSEVVATKDGAKILVNGKDVCFIEFGTGVEADGSTHEGYTFSPGSWSSSELGTGMYATLGYWFYNGTKFTGTPPAHAITQAIAEMESKASEVAEKLKGELT